MPSSKRRWAPTGTTKPDWLLPTAQWCCCAPRAAVLPAVPLLNARELLGPAVLARAGLELAALYAHELHKLVDLFKAAASSPGGHGFVMKDAGGNVIDAEKILVRAIWGWKSDGARDHQPEELRQLNAVTAIHKLAQIVPKISEIYDYLCQVAHPNVAGNARFWAGVQEDRLGTSRVTFGRQSEGPETERIRIAVLWALGWSAAIVHRWSLKLENAVGGVFGRWPDEPWTSARPARPLRARITTGWNGSASLTAQPTRSPAGGFAQDWLVSL